MGTKSILSSRLTIILILVLIFTLYGLYNAQAFLIGPQITIISPQDGQNVENSYIDISGNAKNISNLYLNGHQIFTNEDGFFKEKLLLAKGYNIIQLEASDKFNRSTKKIKRVVYE